MTAKTTLLHALKLIGGFALARQITRRSLRIVCWHSISIEDEHVFRSSLFLTGPELRTRLAWLKAHGFRILGLAEAVRGLAEGTLPVNATVLTFDDGWAAWAKEAADALRGVPVTGYVMTCYLDRPEPIFNLFAQYAYWKSKKTRLALSIGDVTYDELWRQAKQLSLDQRAALLPEIAEATGVDLDTITRDRRFGLLSSKELSDLGWDIQLHTHWHEWGRDPELVDDTLALNIQRLSPVAKNPLQHFCYPAGEFYPENFLQLQRNGIVSATTCVQHFNWPGANPLALGRILDSHQVPQIVFEAKMSGVYEIAHWVRNALRGTSRKARIAAKSGAAPDPGRSPAAARAPVPSRGSTGRRSAR